MTSPLILSSLVRPFRKKAGFGLVEMLVTIVLLAILAIALLPAINRMVERAQTAKCMGHLRSFHTVLNAYAAENNGRLPPYRKFLKRDDGTSVNGPDWRHTIAPYMPDVPRRNRLKGNTVDVCPAADFQSSSSYTFYYALTADSTSATPKPFPQVEAPGRYFVMGDSRGAMRIDRGAGTGDLSFRHQGRAILLFLDGHLESRLPEEIPTQKGAAEYNQFWLGR